MSVVCTAQLADSPKCSTFFCLTSYPDVWLDWDRLTYQMITYLQSRHDQQWFKQWQECLRQYDKHGNPLHGGERRLISKFVNRCFLNGGRENSSDIKRQPSHFEFSVRRHKTRRAVTLQATVAQQLGSDRTALESGDGSRPRHNETCKLRGMYQVVDTALWSPLRAVEMHSGTTQQNK